MRASLLLACCAVSLCSVLWVTAPLAQDTAAPDPIAPKAMPPSQERVPAPDPTRLTTQQLYREIAAMREVAAAEVAALRTALDIDLKAIKADILTLRVNDERILVRIDEKVKVLNELFTERFTAIATQFTSLDKGRTELATITAQNLTTALSAYKELMTQQNLSFAAATAKAEQSTGARIAQLEALVESKIKSLDEKVTAGNERLLRLEGGTAGERLARADAGTSTSMMLAVIGTIIGIIVLGLGVLAAFRAGQRPHGP